MMDCLHVTEQLSAFLGKVASTAIVTFDAATNCTYMLLFKDGLKVVKIKGDVLDGIGNVIIPQSIASHMIPGFYSFFETEDDVVMFCYKSVRQKEEELMVSYKMPKSAVSHTLHDYLPILNSPNYVDSSLPNELLTLYSIVGNVSSVTNKAIEFGSGIAYMSSPGVKVVLSNVKLTQEFMLVSTKFWFLTMFGTKNIDVAVKDNNLSFRARGEGNDITFYMVFPKIKTSNTPNIKRLLDMTPVYTTKLQVGTLNILLSGLIKNKHNPARIEFGTEGAAILRQDNSSVIVPLHSSSLTPVPFSIDADLLKRCVSRIGKDCVLRVYPNNNFLLEAGNIRIIGGCQLVQ